MSEALAVLQDTLTEDETAKFDALVAIASDPTDIDNLVLVRAQFDGQDVAVVTYKSIYGMSPVAILLNDGLFDRLSNPVAALTDEQKAELSGVPDGGGLLAMLQAALAGAGIDLNDGEVTPTDDTEQTA